MIPESDWKWFGCPGHLIVARDCRFHLCTQIGGFLISTVGEWFPGESVREILAKSRGVELRGRGDVREWDYMKKIGFEEIGCDRKYETMVFAAGKPCNEPDCNCGQPAIDGCELEMDGYNDRASATAGHMNLCRKAAFGLIERREEISDAT
jgi:hypothetical protein